MLTATLTIGVGERGYDLPSSGINCRTRDWYREATFDALAVARQRSVVDEFGREAEARHRVSYERPYETRSAISGEIPSIR